MNRDPVGRSNRRTRSRAVPSRSRARPSRASPSVVPPAVQGRQPHPVAAGKSLRLPAASSSHEVGTIGREGDAHRRGDAFTAASEGGQERGTRPTRAGRAPRLRLHLAYY